MWVIFDGLAVVYQLVDVRFCSTSAERGRVRCVRAAPCDSNSQAGPQPGRTVLQQDRTMSSDCNGLRQACRQLPRLQSGHGCALMSPRPNKNAARNTGRHLSFTIACAAYSKPAPRAHLYLAPSTSTGNSVE